MMQNLQKGDVRTRFPADDTHFPDFHSFPALSTGCGPWLSLEPRVILIRVNINLDMRVPPSLLSCSISTEDWVFSSLSKRDCTYFSLKSRYTRKSDGYLGSFKSLADFYSVGIGLCSCEFSSHNFVEYLTYLVYH